MLKKRGQSTAQPSRKAAGASQNGSISKSILKNTTAPPPLPRIPPQTMFASPDFSRVSQGSVASVATSLCDLPADEKAKIARCVLRSRQRYIYRNDSVSYLIYRLVDRLVSLAKEHEELLHVLSNERAQRSEDVQKISDQSRRELELMEDKRVEAETARMTAQSKRGNRMLCWLSLLKLSLL